MVRALGRCRENLQAPGRHGSKGTTWSAGARPTQRAGRAAYPLPTATRLCAAAARLCRVDAAAAGMPMLWCVCHWLSLVCHCRRAPRARPWLARRRRHGLSQRTRCAAAGTRAHAPGGSAGGHGLWLRARSQRRGLGLHQGLELRPHPPHKRAEAAAAVEHGQHLRQAGQLRLARLHCVAGGPAHRRRVSAAARVHTEPWLRCACTQPHCGHRRRPYPRTCCRHHLHRKLKGAGGVARVQLCEHAPQLLALALACGTCGGGCWAAAGLGGGVVPRVAPHSTLTEQHSAVLRRPAPTHPPCTNSRPRRVRYMASAWCSAPSLRSLRLSWLDSAAGDAGGWRGGSRAAAR